jgi:hypothetical protein
MIEAEHELFRVGAAAGGWPACARACAQFWCPPSACMRQDDHEQLCRSAHHFFSGYYCLLAWLLLFPVELRFGSVCFYATILFACFIFPFFLLYCTQICFGLLLFLHLCPLSSSIDGECYMCNASFHQLLFTNV